MKAITIKEACDTLFSALREPTEVLVCIGSRLRSDDAACVVLCESLLDIAQNNIEICEHGLEVCPLASLLRLREVKKLVICDVSLLPEREPGSILELSLEDLKDQSLFISSHSLPQSFLLRKLEEVLPNIEIKIVAINAASLGLSLEMSEEVRKVIEELSYCLKSRL